MRDRMRLPEDDRSARLRTRSSQTPVSEPLSDIDSYPLLRLQQTHGNQYVARQIALAKSQLQRWPSAPSPPSPEDVQNTISNTTNNAQNTATNAANTAENTASTVVNTATNAANNAGNNAGGTVPPNPLSVAKTPSPGGPIPIPYPNFGSLPGNNVHGSAHAAPFVKNNPFFIGPETGVAIDGSVSVGNTTISGNAKIGTGMDTNMADPTVAAATAAAMGVLTPMPGLDLSGGVSVSHQGNQSDNSTQSNSGNSNPTGQPNLFQGNKISPHLRKGKFPLDWLG